MITLVSGAPPVHHVGLAVWMFLWFFVGAVCVAHLALDALCVAAAAVHIFVKHGRHGARLYADSLRRDRLLHRRVWALIGGLFTSDVALWVFR